MRKLKSQPPENEDDVSFLGSLGMHLLHPIVFLRELWNRYVFNFWEDEILDFRNFVFATAPVVVRVVLVLVAFIFGGAFLIQLVGKSADDIRPSSAIPVVASEESSGTESKANSSEQNIRKLIERYQMLEQRRNAVGVAYMNDLGQRIKIGKQLQASAGYKSEGDEILLLACTEMSLECFKENFGVPGEAMEILESVINNDTERQVMKRLSRFGRLAMLISESTRSRTQWSVVENSLVDLLDGYVRGAKHEEFLLRKLESISRNSSFFPFENKFSERIGIKLGL